MINFFNFIYTVIVLNYVIVIRNNQDKINFTLEHIQTDIKFIKEKLNLKQHKVVHI